MPAESSNEWLERNRPPRVHIKYEVHTGGAQALKELPFKVGVMTDLSGQSNQPPPPLAERSFTKVSRDNFQDVMEKCRPRVVIQVDNKIENDGTTIPVDLEFTSMKDMEPDRIVEKVQPLRELMEVRRRLKYALNQLDGNVELKKLLQDVLTQSEASSGAQVGGDKS